MKFVTLSIVMPCTGAEHVAQSTGNTNILKEGGAECGAYRAPTVQFDQVLQQVIDTWPDLPEAIQAGILAMVKAASGDSGEV